MADNINVTPGTGSTIAADDVGGVLHQRVKVTYGPDGSATDVSTSSPFPVTLDSAQVTTLTPPTTVTANLGTLNGAATAANQGTANTSLASIASNIASVLTASNQLVADNAANDLILDETHGVMQTVTTVSSVLLTPATGVTQVWVYSDQLIGIRTDGIVAAAAAGTLPITDAIIPVRAGVAVTAICLNGASSTVYAIPLVTRS